MLHTTPHEMVLMEINWNEDRKNTFKNLCRSLHIKRLELASLLSDLQLVGWIVYVKENEISGYYKLTPRGIVTEVRRFHKTWQRSTEEVEKQIERSRE